MQFVGWKLICVMFCLQWHNALAQRVLRCAVWCISSYTFIQHNEEPPVCTSQSLSVLATWADSLFSNLAYSLHRSALQQCFNAPLSQMSYKIKAAMHYFCKPSCTPLAFHSIPTRCCCTVKDPRCFCKVSSLSHLLRCHRHYHHCAIIIIMIITSTWLLP